MPATRARNKPTPASAFPLPLELFIQVGSYLSTDDLINATHVSQSWRKTLIGTPLLWAELDGVDLTKSSALGRAETLLARANGGLTKLHVGLPNDKEKIEAYEEQDENYAWAVSRSP
jgi:hypothetical protein